MRASKWILLPLALLASSATAQEPVEREEEVCLTVGLLWRGNAEDVARIAEVPVPASFRGHYERGGCSRWQLIEGSLIEWHLEFGNERTTAAALAYLERGETAGIPTPDRFRAELRPVWAAALRAIERADLLGAAGADRDVRRRQVGNDRNVRRARELIAGYESYYLLTEQYLRAAENFASAELLGRAERFFVPVQAGLAIIFRGNAVAMADFEVAPANFLHASARRINDTHNLPMRLATMRARLSRDPAHIDAADAIVQQNFSPAFEAAARNAEQRNGEFCDVADSETDGSVIALRQACDQENSFESRVRNYWHNRAHLDLLMAADRDEYEEVTVPQRGIIFRRRSAGEAPRLRLSLEAFERAMRMWQLEWLRAYRHEVPGHGGSAGPAVELLIARADMHIRLASRLRESSSPEADQQVDSAFHYLEQAQQLAPPFATPGRFRRIAMRYLDLWEGSAQPAGRERNPQRARAAAYFRRTLAALGDISLARD